jgi:hypothetical protein
MIKKGWKLIIYISSEKQGISEFPIEPRDRNLLLWSLPWNILAEAEQKNPPWVGGFFTMSIDGPDRYRFSFESFRSIIIPGLSFSNKALTGTTFVSFLLIESGRTEISLSSASIFSATGEG